MISHAPLFSQHSARWTILITVASMLNFMITSVNSIAPLFTLGGLCPTRNGRIHDLSPTVTRQLVKTGHQAWRTVTTVTGFLTLV